MKTKKVMKITGKGTKYHKGEKVPRISIEGKILFRHGFRIGDILKVEYSDKKIIITNIEEKCKN